MKRRILPRRFPYTLCLFFFLLTACTAPNTDSPTHFAGGREAVSSRLTVHFLEVGYADSILIQFPDGTAALIDAGGPEEDAGPRAEEYLKKHGVGRLEWVLITHPHDNHYGGVGHLARRGFVEQVFINGQHDGADETYAPLLDELRGRGIPIGEVKAGDALPAPEGVKFAVLHPTHLAGGINENSVVTWLTYGGNGFLFTSDIQAPQQAELIFRYPKIRFADVVQIPHHGGKLADGFLGIFSRETVFVVSTGKNPYGKPLAVQWRNREGRVLRTDRGAVVCVSDGERLKVRHAR